MSDKKANAINILVIIMGIAAIVFYAIGPHELFWLKIVVAITYPILSFFLRRKARKK